MMNRLVTLSFILISLPAWGLPYNCNDYIGPVSEYCQKDMYFKCENKGASFKAILHFQTFGRNDSWDFGYGRNHIYLDDGYLGYEAQLWATDFEGTKSTTSETGGWKTLDYDFTVYEDWKSTGKILKKGSKYWVYPDENVFVPTTLRNHIPNNNGAHKFGKTFRVGVGPKKYGAWHNLLTFYAAPERKTFKLFWVVGSSNSDLQVHSVNCSPARKASN